MEVKSRTIFVLLESGVKPRSFKLANQRTIIGSLNLYFQGKYAYLLYSPSTSAWIQLKKNSYLANFLTS